MKDEMAFLNLPDAVQKVVREILQERGKNENTEVDSHSLLLEQSDVCTESCDNFLNSEGLTNLSETELCMKFGLNPETLQKEFSHLFKSILQFF